MTQEDASWRLVMDGGSRKRSKSLMELPQIVLVGHCVTILECFIKNLPVLYNMGYISLHHTQPLETNINANARAMGPPIVSTTSLMPMPMPKDSSQVIIVTLQSRPFYQGILLFVLVGAGFGFIPMD